jgi:hypothetical protein
MTGMSEAAKINAPRKRARVISLPSDLFPDRLGVVLMNVHVPHLEDPVLEIGEVALERATVRINCISSPAQAKKTLSLNLSVCNGSSADV